jgi:hypothetical protein
LASQVENGKAFEWAVATATSQSLGRPILENPAANYAKRCFEKLPVARQQDFSKSAFAAVEHVLKLESRHLSLENPQFIEIAEDDRGKRGDVRDVLIVSKQAELGFSCKTNHDALKHSRLSAKIDFVSKWGLEAAGCSREYWDAVRPLFSQLQNLKKISNGAALFSALDDVGVEYYLPLLAAFSAELSRVMGEGASAPEEATAAFVQYIIGRSDFYKIMNLKSHTSIQGFNFNGSLTVPKSKLPTHLVSLDTLDGGSFAITTRFNRGYAFNFRIHSASSRIEPSFKFDVRGISFGNEIYQHHIALD